MTGPHQGTAGPVIAADMGMGGCRWHHGKKRGKQGRQPVIVEARGPEATSSSACDCRAGDPETFLSRGHGSQPVAFFFQ